MDRVLIWGTGKIANRLLKNGLDAEILGYIETNKTKDWFRGKRVYECTEIPEEYDAIIVANNYSNEIYLNAKNQQLDIEKMIFLIPYIDFDSEEKLEWINKILGKKNFEMYCIEHEYYDRTFYMEDKKSYDMLNNREAFKINEMDLWPIVKDKFDKAGVVDSYFWQDLWAAQLIYKNYPKEHFDIGSRLNGFIAHILSYGVHVNMIDVRDFPIKIHGLNTIVDDATELRQFLDNSIDSLSALCSLEHFGLGRYGDPIDPEACFKCFSNIQEKMKKGGKLYIAVPIGKERLQFNAHRIFYAKTIIRNFNKMKLLEFSCATREGIEKNVDLEKYDNDVNNRGNRFGLFYFERT